MDKRVRGKDPHEQGTRPKSSPNIRSGENASIISVLYVDDETSLLEPIKISLERLGNFSVDTCSNVQDALGMLRKRSYDVIVSDYQMPEMDGIAFLTQLRESGDQIPFIIFTGKGREDAVIEAYDAGADFYLAKGGNPKAMYLDLRKKIEQVYTRRRAEKALKESEERYRKVMEQSHDAIFIIRGSRFVFVNDRVSEIAGFSKHELYDMEIWDLLHPDDRERIAGIARTRAIGGSAPHTYVARAINRDGDVRYLEFAATSLTFNGEDATLCSVRDITDRKRSDEALQTAYAELEQKVAERTRELSMLTGNLQNEIEMRKRVMDALTSSEEKYRSLVEQIRDIVFHINPAGIITYVSPHVLVDLGFSTEQPPKIDIFDRVSPPSKEKIEKIISPSRTLHEPVSGFELEFPVYSKDKTTIFEINATPSYAKDGSYSGYYGIARDITERKNLQNTVAASLKEKEILLKEIHHRVKNNMQVISSLLSLQVKQMKDVTSREALRESQNRVMSIALVHEKLYQSKSFAEIDYYDYLTKIAENLLQSYGIPKGKIHIEIHAEKIVLPISKAIPVSLIINELISNSIKYAFPNDRRGTVLVELRKAGDRYTLVVRDDGIGIPEGIDLDHLETLGLQLVDSLVGQILGTIILNRTKGTEFKIDFTIEPVERDRYE